MTWRSHGIFPQPITMKKLICGCTMDKRISPNSSTPSDSKYRSNQPSPETTHMNHKNACQLKYKAMHAQKQPYLHLLPTHSLSQYSKSENMATVSTQASAAVFRPCTRSKFLTGSFGKLNREITVRSFGSSSSSSLKVEAKQGEWLPGLPSPAYLNGR